MRRQNDPSVFCTPYNAAFEVREVENAATFGRNASKLAYERQRAQTQQAVRQTAQTQAREKARTEALQMRQTAPKETTMPRMTIEELQRQAAANAADLTRLRADHAHFQQWGEYPVRPEECRRLLEMSPLGRDVLQHQAVERAATFSRGAKYSREQLAKLTPKDFADPLNLEYPILTQDDLDAAADAMLEAAKAPMLFDQEKDDRMRSQIRAIAARRGLRLPDHWRTSGLDERGRPIVPTSKHREALEASSLGREVLRQAPKG